MAVEACIKAHDGWAASTARPFRSVVGRYLLPTFGARALKSITSDDIVSLVSAIDSPAQARAVRVRQIFAVAVARGWIDVNPADGRISDALSAGAKRQQPGTITRFHTPTSAPC